MSAPLRAYERLDKDSSAIIERGILIQDIYGSEMATEYLKNRLIPIETISRVLDGRPVQRNFHINMQEE